MKIIIKEILKSYATQNNIWDRVPQENAVDNKKRKHSCIIELIDGCLHERESECHLVCIGLAQGWGRGAAG